MTCLRALVSLALACFALAFASAPASALAAKVAVLPPRLSAGSSAELRDRFQDAVARGLQAGGAPGVEVMTGSDARIRLQANSDAIGCQSGPCLMKLTQQLKVDRLVLAEIDVSSKNYGIVLRLLDPNGNELWRTAENCDICTVREADEAMARAAARVAPWVTRPSAAEKPVEKPVPPPEPVTPVVAAPVAPMAPVPEGRRTYFRGGWIAALVVGGLFVAASVPFLVYANKDGQTNCDPSVAKANCPTIYQGNLASGLGLLLGGGIVGGGTFFGVLYYLDHKAQKRREVPRLSLIPVVGGAMAGLQGRF